MLSSTQPVILPGTQPTAPRPRAESQYSHLESSLPEWTLRSDSFEKRGQEMAVVVEDEEAVEEEAVEEEAVEEEAGEEVAAEEVAAEEVAAEKVAGENMAVEEEEEEEEEAEIEQLGRQNMLVGAQIYDKNNISLLELLSKDCLDKKSHPGQPKVLTTLQIDHLISIIKRDFHT